MTAAIPDAITPQFPPKAEFRRWLRSLPPGEVVAEKWDCFSCPLVLWLVAKGIDTPYVSPAPSASESAWRVIDHTAFGVQPLPEWANKFANAIDRKGQRNQPEGFQGYNPVTATECLAVLRRTPRE